jgi:hypothetical protein
MKMVEFKKLCTCGGCPTYNACMLVRFPYNEKFICKAAGTMKEAKKLGEAGFEYVTGMDHCKLFKKGKLTFLGTSGV